MRPFEEGVHRQPRPRFWILLLLLLLLLQVAVAAVVAVAVVALPVLQLFVLGCLLNTFRYTLAIAKSPPFRPHSTRTPSGTLTRIGAHILCHVLGKAKDLGPHFIPFHSPWAATSPDLLMGSYALAKGVVISRR